MSESLLTAEFIEGSRGKIFVLLRRPRLPSSGATILFVPPFAEEMNKCRRMFSLVADGLVRSGTAALIVDLYGTGDSEGEFVGADWQVWVDDMDRAAAWAGQIGWPVAGVLCVRTGCLLTEQFASLRAPEVRATVFWQPVVNGERFLTQFLRLRVAATMMSDGSKESVNNLRQKLAAGESVEVSGYELGTTLAGQIDRLKLTAAEGSRVGALHWMEVVRDPQAPLSPAATECAERYRAGGAEVRVTLHPGEPFWSSTEIVVNNSIVNATIAAFAETGF